MLFVLRLLRSTGNLFQGSGEQSHCSKSLGSPSESKKKKMNLKNLTLKEKPILFRLTLF